MSVLYVIVKTRQSSYEAIVGIGTTVHKVIATDIYVYTYRESIQTNKGKANFVVDSAVRFVLHADNNSVSLSLI